MKKCKKNNSVRCGLIGFLEEVFKMALGHFEGNFLYRNIWKPNLVALCSIVTIISSSLNLLFVLKRKIIKVKNSSN